MSLFYLNDETVARLRPIAADIVLHALCKDMVTSTGWESDKQKTYGFVDLALMRAALPQWSTKRLNYIARVLVNLEAWTEVENGYQFVGWDKEQRTKASRDGDAARAARCRTRKKVRAEYGAVAEISSLKKRSQTRFTGREKTGFSRAVSNDNSSLGDSVTRDVTPLPSSFSDQSTTCSVDSQPSAAPPPAPIIELQKAKKRTRKATPLDACRAGLVAIFGELFDAKYPGRKSLPKRQDLLTIAAKSLQRPDGTLDESRARAAMAAYLADGWWTAQTSRPGHNFDSWAKHTERYETLADRDRAAEQQGRVMMYGF